MIPLYRWRCTIVWQLLVQNGWTEQAHIFFFGVNDKKVYLDDFLPKRGAFCSTNQNRLPRALWSCASPRNKIHLFFRQCLYMASWHPLRGYFRWVSPFFTIFSSLYFVHVFCWPITRTYVSGGDVAAAHRAYCDLSWLWCDVCVWMHLFFTLFLWALPFIGNCPFILFYVFCQENRLNQQHTTHTHHDERGYVLWPELYCSSAIRALLLLHMTWITVKQ